MPDNLAIARAYMDKFAAADLEGALALCADDAVFRGPDGEAMGKAGLRALMAQFRPLLPNPLEYEIVGTTCEGNRVAIESTASTLLANGNRYSNIYHFLFEVAGGKIVAAREYCDTSRAAAFISA